MQETQPEPRSETGGVPRGIRTMAGWILVVGVAFFGAGLATCGYHVVTGFGTGPGDGDGTTTTVRPTADVVVAVRDLARLETTSYHVERVIDLRDKQRRLFGLLESEDAILLIAAGDVSAGVDLTEMRDGDVVIDPERGTATITLPPPRVLSTRLDSDRTFVHTRQTDLLARRSQTLETRARQEAERTLEQAALDGGILERARDNAARTVETLVRSLGYDSVEIRHRRE